MFKDKEIMNKLNISRQAVYNNKNKGSEKSKKNVRTIVFLQLKSF